MSSSLNIVPIGTIQIHFSIIVITAIERSLEAGNSYNNKEEYLLAICLSNDLEWSKHIATMTNKANSKLSFFASQPEGLPRET